MISSQKLILNSCLIKKVCPRKLHMNPMFRSASTMRSDLLNTLFDCWTKKGNPYLKEIIEEYSNTAELPCVDGDITIWTTRPAKTPLYELKEIASSSNRLEWMPHGPIHTQPR